MYWYLYLQNWLKDQLTREEGQDLSEYALLLVLIATVLITAVIALRTQIETVLNRAASVLATP